ncbi:MAG: hypothetical protein KDA97_04720 [Acidimicrobiales bacterium]|nr:hypothetical protein [Acidimicrobiales bacterium]
MEALTRELWASQDRHEGDRWRLFQAVAGAVGGESVLYPGSFVDVAASFVWPAVTYVDIDRRAARFFADRHGVEEIVATHAGSPEDPVIEFLATDYTDTLALEPSAFDLLLSLYTGFVSQHCVGHLRVGGHLLAHPSHGDVALAALDERYRLVGVVTSGANGYEVSDRDLDTYLIPKKPELATAGAIRRAGKGIAYNRSAFAYLFRRIS